MNKQVKELIKTLNSLRALLDQTDTVEFWRMGKHLDAMTTLVDNAIGIADDMRDGRKS